MTLLVARKHHSQIQAPEVGGLGPRGCLAVARPICFASGDVDQDEGRRLWKYTCSAAQRSGGEYRSRSKGQSNCSLS